LKIETQFQEDHQARLTVEVEPGQLESAKSKAANKIAQRVKIPGFRPGKAPYPVILRTVGEAAIIEEAMEILANDLYPKVLEESGITPYGPGSLEKIEKLDPPTLVFLVPLEATVKLGDYRSLRFPYELKPITDEDVDQAIEDFRDRKAVQEPAGRPAQVGDEVTIRVSAERKEAEPGQSLTLIRDHSTSVIIKSSDEDNSREWPFPGFTQHLIGLNVGDEKSIEYIYPDDTKVESLRGKAAIFRFKVEDILVRKLPELDDEFAKSFGDYESLDAFRAKVKEALEQQVKAEYDESYNEQIIEAILKDAEIKFPPQMLEREVAAVLSQLESRLEQQNLDIQMYLKTRNITEEELHTELMPVAVNRIRRSLALREVSRLEGIKLDPNELSSETTRTLDTISRIYPPREARKLVTGPFVQNMISSIAADMLTTRTFERLQAYAKGEMPVVESAAEAAEATEKVEKPKKRKKSSVSKTSEEEVSGIQEIEQSPVEKPQKTKRKKAELQQVQTQPKEGNDEL